MVSRPLEINASASIRNRSIIQGLLELGHQVDLITSQYDNSHLNYDETILNKRINVKYLKLNGIQRFAKVGRKAKLVRPIKRLVLNIMAKFQIYDNLRGISNQALDLDINDNDYDLIISSSDPKSSHLFIYKLFEVSKVKNTPWIQVWGDPFLADITRKNKLLNLKIKKEEGKLLQYATKVIYVSNLTLKEQKRIYSKYKEKMSYTPIPYSEQIVYPIKNKSKESLTFLYCGDYFSKIRDIKPLYESIKNTKHRLIICGNSDLKLKSTERIKIYPRVSFGRTKELEQECDVLVHLSNLKGTQIPGKIYQYSGTNKLILFILDGDIQGLTQIFDSFNRYAFCQNNVEEISYTLNQLKEGTYDHTRFIVQDFSPEKIANQIINFL